MIETQAPPTLRPQLNGVHHTARPTWRLRETVEFYRDVMGLPLVHAITARGWGADDHPDFLHFFFESGNGSTIAFFYYLGLDEPVKDGATGTYLHRSVHTAWRVETQAELLAWKERFEAAGVPAQLVRHETLESLYVTDPNGYMIEIARHLRPLLAEDTVDAVMTIEAAIEAEAQARDDGGRLRSIEQLWQHKARLVRRYLEREA